MRAYFNALLDLIYPPRCPLCRTLTDEAVCETCFPTLPIIQGPICGYCGRPTAVSKDSCPDCADRDLYFNCARSVWAYQGAARELVHDFKYRNNKNLARRLAPFLVPLAGEADIITWVPLARAKQWSRGYNQAKLLARRLAETTERPAAGLLVRVRTTLDQSLLKPRARRQNVRGAFAVRPGARISGQSIILVDDVYTTGATAAECSRILRARGARSVQVVTLARALGK